MELQTGGYLSFYMPDKQSSLALRLTQPRALHVLLTDVGIPLNEVHLVILNGEIVDLDKAIVTDQDQVKVYSPIDGG